MKIMLFGGTGMVGQGALRECLLDPRVDEVIALGRTAMPESSPKLRQIMRSDLFQLDGLEAEFRAVDACLFCLGVSSVGMKEPEYRRVTYDLTLSIAERFVSLNPTMTFVYVSGAQTDSSGEGKVMWARVKGQTENALLALPLRAAYMFRPGAILPLDGIRSKTALYQAVYSILRPLYPWLEKSFPKHVTTTKKLGRAMLRVAVLGDSRKVLEQADINGIAAQG
jgi:uncharacterized protein YbjT (DUF2867 family)